MRRKVKHDFPPFLGDGSLIILAGKVASEKMMTQQRGQNSDYKRGDFGRKEKRRQCLAEGRDGENDRS